MNWFSKFFGRSRPSPDYDVHDEGFVDADLVRGESAAWKEAQEPEQSNRPQFSMRAGGVGQLTLNAGVGDQRLSWIRSTFIPSQPVAELRRFAGRADMLKRVIRALEHQNLHVVLYGDRGIGKTSMLRVVNELASSANYIVHYASCGEQTDFSSVFRAAARDIPLLFTRDIDPAHPDVEGGGTFADRLPAGDFTVAEYSDLIAKLSGTRALIILDEFDRAVSPQFRNNVAELIKNLSDRSVRVQLLIAGVAANFTDLIAHVPSIRRNIVGMNVPNMSPDEVRELVNIAMANAAIAFDPKAVDKLVEFAGGLPYLASLLGQHAILSAVENDTQTVTTSDVVEARKRSSEEIFSRLTATSQFALEQDVVVAKNSVIRRAAAAAVANGGLIVDKAITDELAKLEEPVASLVQPIASDPRGAWHFAEDGVSSYLWLS